MQFLLKWFISVWKQGHSYISVFSAKQNNICITKVERWKIVEGLVSPSFSSDAAE